MSRYKIPYRAAPTAIPITEKTKKDVMRVLENPRQTNEIELFETEFSKYCNSKYTLTVNGCTSAMHLGLLACGVGKGDEVITQPNSFVTTGDCITYVGAKPVFADIDGETLAIDPVSIKEKITPKTKAILDNIKRCVERCARIRRASIQREEEESVRNSATRGKLERSA